MKLDVTYQNDKISFTHLKKKNIKNVYLTIDKNDGIIVKSGPHFQAEDARRIVLEKAEWIRSKLATIDRVITTALPHYEKMERLFLDGIPHTVKLEQETALKKTEIITGDGIITIRTHPEKTGRIPYHLETFYRQRSEAAVLPLVESMSRAMGLYPESVSFRKYKRRWGCCDSRNRIVFNTLLAQFPHEIVRYIVIHELAHIQEKNHSQRFWKIVEKYQPDYKEIHRRIKGGY